MITLPSLALSVRQPWAWAIIHAGKTIENRSWNRRYASAHGPALDFRGRVCIHAGKGMTRDEYLDAASCIRSASGIAVPAPHLLPRGGIIGTVEIVDVVRKSDSPWFFGPVGLVLKDPEPVDFIPCRGALSYFEWQPDPDGATEPPARWMLPQDARTETSIEAKARQGELL